MERKHQDELQQIKMKKEINALNYSKTELQLRLQRIESSHEEVVVALGEMVEKVQHIEKESAEKSCTIARLEGLLLRSNPKDEQVRVELCKSTDQAIGLEAPPISQCGEDGNAPSLLENMKNELLEMRQERIKDKVIIEKMTSAEKLHENKIKILMDIKSALEEKIIFLESQSELLDIET